MQIARLEAQIRRDMRMLRLEMESRMRRIAIDHSRRNRSTVRLACDPAGWYIDQNGESVQGLKIFGQLLRLRDDWGDAVIPKFRATYVDGELSCSS
jgi:hypothetical protein